MDKVVALEMFTKLFQLCGLQFFSLKSLERKVKRKYPSPFYSIYMLIILAWATIFVFFSFEDNMASSYASENYLSVVIKFLNYMNYIASIYICVVLSFFKNSDLKKFFQHSMKIKDLCLNEFDFEMDFRKVWRKLVVWSLVYAAYFLTLLYRVLSSPSGNTFVSSIVLPISWVLIAVYVQMIAFRFNFYVQVLNFHLKTINKLLRENFLSNSSDYAAKNLKTIKILKVSLNDYLNKNKITTLQKMYLLIKEMAECVNSTMGFAVMLRLFMVITNMIRFGYDSLRDVSGSFGTIDKIWSELFSSIKCLFFINHLLFIYFYEAQVFWLLFYTLTMFMIFHQPYRTKSYVCSIDF